MHEKVTDSAQLSQLALELKGLGPDGDQAIFGRFDLRLSLRDLMIELDLILAGSRSRNESAVVASIVDQIPKASRTRRAIQDHFSRFQQVPHTQLLDQEGAEIRGKSWNQLLPSGVFRFKVILLRKPTTDRLAPGGRKTHRFEVAMKRASG